MSSSFTSSFRIANPGWLEAGFIHDEFVSECQRHQGKPFLRTGAPPRGGQRVELSMFVADDSRDLPFRLSGEVVEILPMPPWETAATTIATAAAASRNHDEPRRVSMTSSCEDGTDDRFYWRPSVTDDDSGPGAGSITLSHLLSRMEGLSPEDATNLPGVWKRLSPEMKRRASDLVVKTYGARHGQEVVCEGRLNFDYDIRRSTEEGPCRDCIPFDARDIWRFVIAADDSMENMWHVIPSSFENLGRDRRVRCWPWSGLNSLPFLRPKVDAPMRGSGPDGVISVHTCIGPFGCSGDDHPHCFTAKTA